MCSHSDNEFAIWTNTNCSDCWRKPICPISKEKYIPILANVCFQVLTSSPLNIQQTRFLDLILSLSFESRCLFLSEIPSTTLDLSPDVSKLLLTAVCTCFPDSFNGLIWCSRLVYNTFNYYNTLFNKKSTFLSECKVCFDAYPDWALLECGHSLCKDCLAKVHNCPFCRRTIYFHVESLDVKNLMNTRRQKYVNYRGKNILLVEFLMKYPCVLTYTKTILDFLSYDEKYNFFYKCLEKSLYVLPLIKDEKMTCFLDFIKLNPPSFEDVLLFISTCTVNKKNWDSDLKACLDSVFNTDQIHALQKLTLGCYYTSLGI